MAHMSERMISHVAAHLKYWQLNMSLTEYSLFTYLAGLGGSVECASDWRPGGRGFDLCRGLEIDHEIFSTVMLSLPQVQEGQLSVSGERMCTILVNR